MPAKCTENGQSYATAAAATATAAIPAASVGGRANNDEPTESPLDLQSSLISQSNRTITLEGKALLARALISCSLLH